tara:strand:- start:259 stop:972 length:714 start_codon:yes stop_codon:yes gene_type:complete
MLRKKINTIAIIIARGGSKRIFKKNIKLFLGEPIIKYSIDTALKCDIFDEVMVSTDDNEIAELSKKLGAKVPFLRSVKNSSDFSSTADAVYEVLKSYDETGVNPKHVCCIYPTAPLISHKTLIDAYDIIINQNAKSVIPVTKFSYPIQRALMIKNNKLKMNWPENTYKRSQDLKDFYHDVGQFYFLKVQNFLKEKILFSDLTYHIELPPIFAQDIDNLEDWSIAELKYTFLKKNNML